jgi:hypothetical protein
MQADIVAVFNRFVCLSTWIDNRYGTSSVVGRLPKFLRIRFFSVNV